MPTYDYRCPECCKEFEVERPMRSRSVEHCPACGAPGKRLFRPVGVAFKGSGFHNTDYRSRPAEEKPSECPAKSGSGCSGCPASE